MALLRTRSSGRLLGAAVAILLGGCGPEPNGALRLDLYDAAVECEPSASGCATASGERVSYEVLDDPAFMSRRMSRFGEDDGYYLYFEAPRQNGAMAVLELDLPVKPGAAESLAPSVSYRELVGGAVAFASTQATGRVELPAIGSCPCQDGRFELRFVAPGADGLLGTADDEERRLDRGHFGPQDAACWRPSALALATPLAVVPTCSSRALPGAGAGGGDWTTGGSGGGSTAGGGDGSVDIVLGGGGDDWTLPDPDYYPTDYGSSDGGCDADDSEGCDAGSSGSGEGCDSSSSDSGCEGDSTEGCDSADSSGCEGAGDLADSGECRIAARGGLQSRRTQRALGLLLPWAAFGLVHRRLSRRARRRARGEGARG